MVKIGSILESGMVPVETLEPLVQVGVIVSDKTKVAFEVDVIDGVISDDGGVQPDISFGQSITHQKLSAIAQPILDLLKRLGQGLDSSLVSLLRARETRLVHAIVDIIVHPFVQLVDFLFQVFRVQIKLGLVGGQFPIESSVEETDNLARFVVHDGVFLFIPNYGYSEPGRVVGLGFEVEVAEMGEAEEGVRCGVGEGIVIVGGCGSGFGRGLVFGDKVPSALEHVWVDGRNVEKVLETFELSDDQSPVCPRTGQADIEVVPSLLWGELASRLNKVSERADLSLERAVLAGPAGDVLFVCAHCAAVLDSRRELCGDRRDEPA